MADKKPKLRSREWFDDPSDPGSTALYLERYLNYGLTMEELQAGKPLIGIANSGSELAPCNKHFIDLMSRIKDGIRDAGGVPIEFPVHPIQETGRRPTAALDRNLAYLGLVETLQGYPLDGVVLTTGCDKTTPSQIMAAATVNLPAIVLSGGPMLNGHHRGSSKIGSGTINWIAREKYAAGEIDVDGFMQLAGSSAPSAGHCNTMGTALSMNTIAEALGMSLPGCAAIPAPYRERGQMAYYTGKRIVDMVWEDLTPSKILTREAIINAIRVGSAVGCSSNCPPHLLAIARHAGVEHSISDWLDYGHPMPLLVNCQPAGEHLGEDFHRGGGVQAVIRELAGAGLIEEDTVTVTGKSLIDNLALDPDPYVDRDVIKPFDQPLMEKAGYMVLSGNLFDSALMKTSVISPDFRARYLSNPNDPEAFEVTAFVFEGPEDYHRRINDESLGIEADSILVVRGCGPIGYPGSAEVVNMLPPDRLVKQGIISLPTMGDGRQSGTSASPSILNASPEAAVGGGLSKLRTGDRVRIDLNKASANALVDDAEWAAREAVCYVPDSQSPWQEIAREKVTQLGDGAIVEGADRYQDIRKAKLRHSH
ncbi:MAG: IlvD/Edd family dehydratase [Pseudomonadota bacterium]